MTNTNIKMITNDNRFFVFELQTSVISYVVADTVENKTHEMADIGEVHAFIKPFYK